MIFYGTRATQILAQAVDLPCPECGKSEQLALVIQKYVHIFWIPTFPLNKVKAVQCLHCKKASVGKDLSIVQQNLFTTLKGRVRTPKWTFAGLLIIALLFAWGSVSGDREKAQTQAWAQSPLTGDVAAFKSDKEFRVLKIVGIEGNKVQVLQSRYVYTSAYQAQSHQKKIGAEPGQYFPELYQMDLAAYRQLEIAYVKRP